MGTNPLGYRAYLLRLWQVREGETLVWRASLESLDTERRGFPDLESLFEYLEEQLAAKNGGQLNMLQGGLNR